jgi:tRNA/tmRNA/rRNA uracil-C5-methylase (TrmA/RlmC/RlmD family)
MAEHLRTDYDRMVGESYRDYAARCRGRMLAAEEDREVLAAKLQELRERLEFAWQEADEQAGQRTKVHVDLWRELERLRGIEQRAYEMRDALVGMWTGPGAAAYILGDPAELQGAGEGR